MKPYKPKLYTGRHWIDTVFLFAGMLVIIILLVGLCFTYFKASATPAPDKPNATDAPLSAFTYLGTLYVTGYNPTDAAQCGNDDGIGANNTPVIPGRDVAMHESIPFGTRIAVVGLGQYTVNDRGVGRGTVDVACAGYSECFEITDHYPVYIIR